MTTETQGESPKSRTISPLKTGLVVVLVGAVAILVKRALDERKQREEPEYVDALAKLEVGKEIQDIPESVADAVSQQTDDVGKRRRIITRASEAIMEKLSKHKK